MEHEMRYEQEINLKDALVAVLRRWRMILVALVIGALLLGGWKMVSNLLAAPETVVLQEATEELPAVTELIKVPLLRDVPKQAVLGAFLGVLLVCVYAFLRFISDKTLRGETEMEERFRTPVFAVLHGAFLLQGKKNGIDKLIDRFAGIPESVDTENQFALAATKIQLLTKGQPVLITGTASQETIAEVQKALCRHLPEGYPCEVSENLLNCPKRMLELKDRCIVVIETAHGSDTREISRLLEFLHMGETKVIGAVVM